MTNSLSAGKFDSRSAVNWRCYSNTKFWYFISYQCFEYCTHQKKQCKLNYTTLSPLSHGLWMHPNKHTASTSKNDHKCTLKEQCSVIFTDRVSLHICVHQIHCKLLTSGPDSCFTKHTVHAHLHSCIFMQSDIQCVYISFLHAFTGKLKSGIAS